MENDIEDDSEWEYEGNDDPIYAAMIVVSVDT